MCNYIRTIRTKNKFRILFRFFILTRSTGKGRPAVILLKMFALKIRCRYMTTPPASQQPSTENKMRSTAATYCNTTRTGRDRTQSVQGLPHVTHRQHRLDRKDRDSVELPVGSPTIETKPPGARALRTEHPLKRHPK